MSTHMNYSMAARSTYFCGTLRREQRANLPTPIMMGTRRQATPQQVKDLSRGQTLTMFSNYGTVASLENASAISSMTCFTSSPPSNKRFMS